MKIFLILIFTSFTYGFSFNSRIAGGNVANPNQFPFAVLVLGTPLAGRERFCGGALISRQSILTAAVCVTNYDRIRVGLGVHDMSIENEPFAVWMVISEIHIHPDYSSDETNNLAVLRLPNAIGFFNHAVQLISLPSNADEQFLNVQGNVVGWGCTAGTLIPTNCSPSNVLRSLTVTTQAASSCTATPAQICAAGGLATGTCFGDEGGPLFTTFAGNPVLIGISHNFPGLCIGSSTFIRLTNFLPWIRSLM